jgi:hypothetical protein
MGRIIRKNEEQDGKNPRRRVVRRSLPDGMGGMSQDSHERDTALYGKRAMAAPPHLRSTASSHLPVGSAHNTIQSIASC